MTWGRRSASALVIGLGGLLPLWAEAPQADGRLGLDRSAMPAVVEGFRDVPGGVWRDGRVYLAGQPSEDAFASFLQLGVTVVVNLRTPDEMNDRDRVPFDEDAVLADLGIEYVHIPLGGDDHPYDPAAVDRFAEVLASTEGPVLLHCTVAWRASHLWAAYLVREQGFTLSEAVARGRAVNFGTLPVEGLVGRPVELVFAD